MFKILKKIIRNKKPDILIKTGEETSNKKLLRCAFSHHKCGTNYMNKVFRAVCNKTGLEFILIKDNFGEHGKSFNAIQYYKDLYNSFKFNKEFCFYQRGNYERHIEKPDLQNYRAFHIVRDPRDIIVSGYFSHKYSHYTKGSWGEKWLTPYREWLNSVSKEEGLMNEIKEGHALDIISRWNFNNPSILEIKFENLISRSFEVFSQILNHLKIDINPKELGKVIEHFSFENMTKGRKPGEEDVTHHFRKGTPGDWRNHFTQKHIEFFKEKWGDLVIKLGYEKNNNW